MELETQLRTNQLRTAEQVEDVRVMRHELAELVSGLRV